MTQKFTGKVSGNPKAVAFSKCEPFNRKFQKSQMERKVRKSEYTSPLFFGNFEKKYNSHALNQKMLFHLHTENFQNIQTRFFSRMESASYRQKSVLSD